MPSGEPRAGAKGADRSQAVDLPGGFLGFSSFGAQHPHVPNAREAGPSGIKGFPGALDFAEVPF